VSLSPFAINADGVRLAVRLTPRGGRPGVDGVAPGADGRLTLRLRVAAPPVDGAANAALIELLATAITMRRSDISILSGKTSRIKIVQLHGDGVAIATKLQTWINGD
jgi:uncharacterized protein (TIGR00251 family)